MDKAGELGLLGTAVPEAYGGFGMNFNTSMLVAEVLGAGYSFSVAQSAHTGIGTLPILYYGNEEQKQKYLPNLASGVWKAAYCLTEPDSGSDANSGKTKAELTADGKFYKITGQKMWITNGGFADVFIVFAKIEDDKNLTAFIVEKSHGGITMNEPEHKMGIKGSDTRQIFFNDCMVPVENMLSDRENGFKIAVNILNIGRIKLGIAAIGGSKGVLNHAVNYANERKQFGKNLAQFQAVQQNLATFACEAAAANCAAMGAAQALDRNADSVFEVAAAKLRANRAVGAGTALAHQVHGAIGFTEEYPLHPLTRRLWAWRSEFGNDSRWSELLGARITARGANNFWADLTA